MKNDTNKTAMQELIEYIESNEIVYNKDLILKLKELLEKEKEQIIKAVNYGNRQDFYDATENELSNHYYNITYNK